MQNVYSLTRRVSLFCAVAALSLQTGHAQVVTSNSALDQLGATAEKPAREAKSPSHTANAAHSKAGEKPAAHTPAKGGTEREKTTGRAEPPAQAATPSATQPAQPAQAPQTAGPSAAHTPARPAPAATIPAAPPPLPLLSPTPAIALHPFPIPPQPTVVLTAAGAASPIAGGIRVTFAPSSDELNPGTHQAILTFGQSLADKPNVRAVILAYSSGLPNDPSMPRRMALLRGLAARSVLMNSGIPSTRIYVRVIGTPPAGTPDNAQDYIDLTQSDTDTQP